MVSALYDRVIDSTLSRLAGSVEYSTSGCPDNSEDDDGLTGNDTLPLFIAVVVLSMLLLGTLVLFLIVPRIRARSENGLDQSLMDKA